MKKTSLQAQILNVLQTDSTNNMDGSGMSVSEIARSVYGIAYGRKTASLLEKSIRERMGYVVELASSNGITIFAVRKSSNPKTPEIKSRIACWKIFNPSIIGMNEELFEELRYKKRNGESRTAAFKKLFEVAVIHNVLNQERVKELTN